MTTERGEGILFFFFLREGILTQSFRCWKYNQKGELGTDVYNSCQCYKRTWVRY